jgi:nitrite reductase/ring-hydroxylating ferredoxin subunit
MSDVYVADIDDFVDGSRRIIVVEEGLEIGVFHRNGNIVAYENLCAHQGGPACEGLIMHKVEDVILPDKTYKGQRFSETETHFVCPWHGFEYDIATGECAADRTLRLRKFDVVTKEKAVYVVV